MPTPLKWLTEKLTRHNGHDREQLEQDKRVIQEKQESLERTIRFVDARIQSIRNPDSNPEQS